MLKQTELQDDDEHAYFFRIVAPKTTGMLTAIVDFQPVRALANRQELASFSILPTFNPDQMHYSPAFVNPYEGLELEREMITRFEEKLKLATTEISSPDIEKAKPKKRKKKCWVCYCDFNDYHSHIESEPHLECIKYSKYNRLLKDLAKQLASKARWKGVVRSCK